MHVLVLSTIILNEYVMLAQLSLTNPRDALHHSKQQNFTAITAVTAPLLWVICHPVARIDIAYMQTKFDEHHI